MKILRGYKTELKPNNKQATFLLQSAGVARFAYNWGLEQKKAAMLAKTKSPRSMDLNKKIVVLKRTSLPWLSGVSKWCAQEALRDLDIAFDNFFRKCLLRKAGKLKGKLQFPQFKSKRNGVGNFRLYGVKVFGDSVQLPKIGMVRLKEVGYLPTDKKIINATISHRAGRWYIGVCVEEESPIPNAKSPATVGVDLGIKALATCSDGQVFENPKALGKNLKKVRRLCRLLARKKKGSSNRKKAATKLSRLYQRIANIRKDSLHKITTRLTKTKSRIVIEDLNVAGMKRNRRLSRAVSDVGLFEFRRQLTYKGSWYGCTVVVADRFFPSTKRCCQCGNLKEEVALAERTYSCECGNNLDRDMNAAINLANWNSTVSSTES